MYDLQCHCLPAESMGLLDSRVWCGITFEDGLRKTSVDNTLHRSLWHTVNTVVVPRSYCFYPMSFHFHLIFLPYLTNCCSNSSCQPRCCINYHKTSLVTYSDEFADNNQLNPPPSTLVAAKNAIFLIMLIEKLWDVCCNFQEAGKEHNINTKFISTQVLFLFTQNPYLYNKIIT